LYTNHDSPKAVIRTFLHGWGSSGNDWETARILPDGITAVGESLGPFIELNTAKARIGYKRGVHVWEISYEHPIDNRSFHYRVPYFFEIIGVSTKNTRPKCWGWELVSKSLYPDYLKFPTARYPVESSMLESIDIGTNFKIRLILDCDNHELRFELNGNCLGTAVTGLPRSKLYPTLLFFASSIKKTIVYIGTGSVNPLRDVPKRSRRGRLIRLPDRFQ